MPPITTVASGRCTSAPVPVASAIGKNPSDATKAVISTGLRRVSDPSTTAGFKSIPSSRSLLMKEIITTPFNTATPERAMNPTAADMDSGIPLIHSETMPPVHANGTPVNMISACWVDPNAANSIIKIKKSVTGTTTHKRWVAEIKCSKVPPQDIQ